jgi:hypothetical protein
MKLRFTATGRDGTDAINALGLQAPNASDRVLGSVQTGLAEFFRAFSVMAEGKGIDISNRNVSVAVDTSASRVWNEEREEYDEAAAINVRLVLAGVAEFEQDLSTDERRTAIAGVDDGNRPRIRAAS